MTVYNFTQVLVWDNLGGSVKVARNQRVNVTDPSTGAVAPGLTVSGQPVSFVTSDSNGHVSFAATIGTVTLTGPNGFSMNVQSPDAYVQATQAAADAASSANSAAASAQSAQDSAGLVGAPAGAAVDARLGSGVGLSVSATSSISDVQAALDDAAANKKRAVAYGTITTSSTLLIKGDCDLSQLTINYTGSGVAVLIGSDAGGVTVSRFKAVAPRVIAANKTATGWAAVAGTIGIRVQNAYRLDLTIPHIQGFETGLQLRGYGAGGSAGGTGLAYCHFSMGHLDNNKINLHLTGDSLGFVNQNTFISGRLSHNSNEGSKVAGTRHILIDPLSNKINNNQWYGTSLESPGVVEKFVICSGSENYWNECRWEDSSGGATIQWLDGVGNRVRGGFGSAAIVDTTASSTVGASVESSRRGYVMGDGSNGVDTNSALVSYENYSGSTKPILRLFAAGAKTAGVSNSTGWTAELNATYYKGKQQNDAYERVRIEHSSGKIFLGNGTAAPTASFWGTGAFLFVNSGSTFGFDTDNTGDIGAATAYRPRYIRAATAVRTGTFATASRPAASTAGAGAMIFDTTLNKPVWSDGTNWRDATGAIV